MVVHCRNRTFVAIAIAAATTGSSSAQDCGGTWLNTDLRDGPFGSIFSFYDADAYESEDRPVYVLLGGAFDYLGGSVRANSLALWDGVEWIPAGGPQGQNIAVIAERSGTLWVGSVGAGISRMREGGGWSNPGLNGLARSLAVDSAGRVIATGDRFTADAARIDGVAAFEAGGWSSVGGGIPGVVQASVVDASGRIFVGGEFEMAGGVPANNVAMWDGVRWHALGLGTNGPVHSLALTSAGELIAAGEFRFSGLSETNNVARWDGERWHAFGAGTDGIVRAVHVAGDGKIFAGGWFANAGSVAASNVAVWDGMAWQALDEGIVGRVSLFHDEGVYALHSTPSGELLVGGNFVRAGDSESRFIARWSSDRNPWIAREPVPTRIVCGLHTTLEVGVPQGYGVSYQWQRDGVNLVDGLQPSGGEVSGAHAPKVTLINGTIRDAGMYSVIISNPCGSISSRQVAVSSRTDLDGDFRITIFDFLAFGALFDAGSLDAEFDGDGRLTVFDFLTFQSDFDEGC